MTYFLTLPFSIVFIFGGLIHYIYCSTLISTIIQHVQIILLYTVFCCYYCYYYCRYYYYYLYYYDFYYHYFCYYYCSHYFIYLFHLKFICIFLFIFFFIICLLMRGPIQPEGTPVGRFFNREMLGVEGVS